MSPEEVLAMVEETTCAAGLSCSAATVRSAGLTPSDFLYPSTAQVWSALLRMDVPSQVLLADIDMDLMVAAQTWVGRYGVYCHPAGLEAHAALVRREGAKRRRVQAKVNEINEIRAGNTEDWWSAYEN